MKKTPKTSIPKLAKATAPRIANVSVRATMEDAWKKFENKNKIKKVV